MMEIAASPLPYIAVAESFKLPPGMNFRGTSGIAFNSKGNIFVIHRGPTPINMIWSSFWERIPLA